MSWSSASVAPSGRQFAIRLSPTPLQRAHLVGPARQGGVTHRRSPHVWVVSLDVDVEVVGVEVVVGAQLRVAQAELLGACSGGCRARRCGSRRASRRIACAHRRRELEVEELVDARDGAHRVGDELGGGGRRGTGPRRCAPAPRCRARPRRAGAPTTSRPSRCRSRSPSGAGKIADTRLAHDGTALTGSRWVTTNRASG